MIGDFFDEHVGNVRDDDTGSGRRIDVDHVDPDAADADHDTLRQARDDLLVDLDAPRRNDGVGIGSTGDEFARRRGLHLDEIRNRLERFEFERITLCDVARFGNCGS